MAKVSASERLGYDLPVTPGLAEGASMAKAINSPIDLLPAAFIQDQEQAKAIADAALRFYGHEARPVHAKDISWGCTVCGRINRASTMDNWCTCGGPRYTPAPQPGILSDIPAMRERAERVKARARHKDLDGETARLLACDVLSLIEALEELA